MSDLRDCALLHEEGLRVRRPPMILLLVASLGMVQGSAWGAHQGEIVLTHPEPLNGVVRTYSGRCGSHHFGISIEPAAVPQNRLRSLAVNNREVDARRKAEIVRLIGDRTELVEAVFDRCESGRPTRVRARLAVYHHAGQERGLRHLAFWLSSNGEITQIRYI